MQPDVRSRNAEQFGTLDEWNEIMKVIFQDPRFCQCYFRIANNALTMYADKEILFSIPYPCDTKQILEAISLTTGVGIYGE